MQRASWGTIVAGLRALIMSVAALAPWLPGVLGSTDFVDRAYAQTIIYVNAAVAPGGDGQSWGSAYNDLQAGLVAGGSIVLSGGNAEVWIAAGTYVPSERLNATDARSATFLLRSNVSLYGGFAGTEMLRAERDPSVNITRLSGDLLGDDLALDSPSVVNYADNAYRVMRFGATGGTAHIDGLLVTGGNANAPGAFPPGESGGGLWIQVGTGNVQVVNCTFYRNRGEFGGAIANNGGAALTINRCRFISNASTLFGGALQQDSVGSLVATSSFFSSNTCAASGGALHIAGTSTVQSCTFTHNSAGGLGGAIRYSNSSNNVLNNCILWDNSAQNGPISVNVAMNAFANTYYNVVEGGCGGLVAEGTGSFQCDGSTVGDLPVLLDPSGQDNIYGTLDDDPSVSVISPCLDAGRNSDLIVVDFMDVFGNRRVHDGNGDSVPTVDIGAVEVGAGAYQQRIFVRSGAQSGGNGATWQTAFSDLQLPLRLAAIPAAGVCEIWVAAGTYLPSLPLTLGGSRSDSFQLQTNLAIYGGFAGNEMELSQRDIAANPTIMSGDLNGDDNGDLNRGDNSYHVVTASGISSTAVLDGLSITSGHASSGSDGNGGGLYCTSSSPTLSNCRFLRNHAEGGGAVSMISGCSPQFSNCDFEENRCLSMGVGGGIWGAALAIGQGSFPIFRQCSFAANRSDSQGGVVLSWGGSHPYFIACRFERNVALSLGGVFVQGASEGSVSAVSCTFAGNTGLEGGVAYVYPGHSLSLYGCLLVGNTGSRGGGVFNNAGLLLVSDSTICGNRALTVNDGAGVFASANGSTQVRNGILWGNRGNQLPSATTQIGGSSSFSLSYTSSELLTDLSSGNNGLDPRFRRLPLAGPDNVWGTSDDDYGDLRVTNGSPATDSGDSSAVPLDVYDIDGDGNTTESLPWDLDGLPRFVNDPLVDNTGIGNPPVDRGCYEFVPPVITAPGERRWVSPSGGEFASLLNWFPAVPGPLDDAVFDIGSVYTVSFPPSPPAPVTQTRTARISRGAVSFDLNGSSLNISAASEPALIVGDLPGVPAAIMITDGTVAPFSARIGEESGSFGSVTVSGNTGRLSIAQDDLSVGFFGQGHLTITNGADVVSRTAGVGDQPGSEGSSVVMTGIGTTWNIPFFLAINNGSVTVSDQAVLSAGFGIFLFQNGTIGGDGIINADVVNFGTIAPGNSPGVLTINGSYEQVGIIPELGANSGKLLSQVAGALPGQFDQLLVNGTATLGGGLFVEFMDGYVPTPDGQGVYPVIPLVQSSQALPSRFDVAFFPPVPVVEGQGAKFLRAVYPNRGPGTVELIVADLGSSPDFDDPNSYQLSGGPTAADVGDLNNDGLPDLAIALPDADDPENNNGDVVVLFNLGNDPQGNWLGFGNSTQITVGKNPSGVAIGDFDGQNGNDVAATNMHSNSVSILSQQVASGSFANDLNLPTGNEPTAVAAFNLDRVGRIDLVVINGADNSAMMMANSNGGGGPGFVPTQVIPTGVRPVAVRPFNPDNDKDVDLVVANQGSSSMSVMPNQGFGTFGTALTISVGAEPSALVAGSLLNRDELDKRQDLVVVNRAGGSVSIVVNTTPELTTDLLSFAPAVESVLATSNPDGSQPRSVAMVDLDGDGDLDVAVLARDSEDTATAVRLLRNDLNGGEQLAFVESASLSAGLGPIAVLTADVDADGQSDLITVNGGLRGPGGGGSVNVLRNAFSPPPPPCAADFDSNGQVQVPDIFVFLSAWFALDPRADFNHIQGVSVPDIFAFLAAWFAGCP